MGRYQAQRDGEPEELAQALDEFYMPRFSGDRLPQSQTGIAIALAERLDTLVGVFGIGMKPTGDKDPFALRRAALGALRILREHALPLNLMALLQQAAAHLGDKLCSEGTVDDVYHFMLERLKGLYLDNGTPLDVFEAVAAVRPESIADFEHRVRAVGDFRVLPEAEALAAANKRIGNILKKTDEAIPDTVDTALFELTAERDLYEQMVLAAQRIEPMMQNANYGGTLQALAQLRGVVDVFFDDVMVMAEKSEVRRNRLAMLRSLSQQFLQVADISVLKA
jgi:glycyl-tRNA synthetase beta chain